MKKLILIVPFLSVILGLCLMVYPWVSNYIYENRVDSIVNAYEDNAGSLEDKEKEEILRVAKEYNKQLSQAKVVLTDPFAPDLLTEDGTSVDYNAVLSTDDSGLMCSLEIPKISVYLPIYHGTSGNVLERGVGHLENSSLPVGGKDTHAVLSAHTGLNSAKLFTDLVDLEEGDRFFIHVLGDTLAYQVCEINIVEPDNTDDLSIKEGRDLVTLITCTPYGVNSHRLLVTGERIEYSQEVYEEAQAERDNTSDSLWMKTYREAVMTGLILVLACSLFLLSVKRIQRI